MQLIIQLFLKSQLFSNRQKMQSIITEHNRAALQVTVGDFWVHAVMT